jgi:hypothetical protein
VVLIFNKEKQMAAKKRIYAVSLVAAPDDNGLCPTRLVRATNKSQAISYVAKTDYVANVASQETLVACINDGVDVEDAVEDVVEETSGSGESDE